MRASILRNTSVAAFAGATKRVGAVLVASGLIAAAAPAAAASIVDTGANPNGTSWNFAQYQYFAGEFTIAEDHLINQVEGYFSNFAQSGTVTAQLFSDGGNIPGALLFSQSFMLQGGSSLAWYGISGLNWEVNAGTYWLAFAPDANISGIWPGGAPSPLGEYSQVISGVWQDLGPDFFDYLDVGIRISGTPVSISAPVPEPGTWAMMLLGFGFVGGAMRARRRQKVTVSYA